MQHVFLVLLLTTSLSSLFGLLSTRIADIKSSRIVNTQSRKRLFLPQYSTETDEIEIETYNLTPKLKEYTQAFRSVKDEKLRYQQLLFMAAKCPALDDGLRIDANLVPGCLSTVHVHASKQPDGTISFEGDSDSQLTKGILTMFINGLSGCTTEEILKVKVEFVQYAGISKSLTPGRNNGLLNMFHLMRKKTMALQEPDTFSSSEAASADSSASSSSSSSSSTPLYDSIMKKLSMLKPAVLELEDESYKHAGHAGTKGLASSETHFNVNIEAACFARLSLVQRHKMIYTLLAEEMNGGVHALSIKAKVPE